MMNSSNNNNMMNSSGSVFPDNNNNNNWNICQYDTNLPPLNLEDLELSDDWNAR